MSLRPRAGLAGTLRLWSGRGRRVLRRITAKARTSTLFLDADGAVSWPGVPGAAPVRYPGFGAWAVQHPESRALLVVSGKLLHTLRIGDAAQGADGDGLRRAVAQRFSLYHGAPTSLWPIAVDRATGFACALHGIGLPSIVAAAVANDIVFDGMVPLWSEVLARAAPRVPALQVAATACLLLVEQGLVTCLTLAEGALIDVQQRFLDAATPAALDDLIDRLASEATWAPDDLIIAGWGIDGIAADDPRLALGPLAERPEGAAWLFAASQRANA